MSSVAERERVAESPSASQPGGLEAVAALSLQTKIAERNLRRHWLRDAARVSVLLAVDLAVFFVLRLGVRLIRDAAVLGGGAAGWLAWLWPPGTFSGFRFVVALLLSLVLVGAYGPGDRRRDVARLFKASALAGALVFYPQVWDGEVGMVVLRWGVLAGVFGMCLGVARWVVDWVVGRVSPRVVPIRAVLVTHGAGDWIGVPELEAAAREGRSRIVPVGSVVAGRARTDGALPLGELGRLIVERGADSVLVAGPLSDADFLYVLDIARLHGCQLLAASRTVRVAGLEPRAVWMSGRVLVELKVPALGVWQLALKRTVDILGSAAGLILLSPLLLVVALLVKLESPGPAFFRQERVGRGGRRFQIIKFRSMVDGAERQQEALLGRSVYRDPRLFKVPDDPRVTRLGRFLRRTSLDELPQLVNVLMGDMSLVGPRPPLPSEVALYEPRHYIRLNVKPGITGPWQVSGRNEVTDFEEVVSLEAEYIRGWSLGRDFEILLRTVPTVLRRRGAY
ncbi:UDP-glucose:undecaprenyl-phosphate glucose-1-phosphate transferase [bacterium HR33]|nr:UDP-glucose:undecaprenyl-phosphate glucose-1-phosphate transferase [bacterium HR33]